MVEGDCAFCIADLNEGECVVGEGGGVLRVSSGCLFEVGKSLAWTSAGLKGEGEFVCGFDGGGCELECVPECGESELVLSVGAEGTA